MSMRPKTVEELLRRLRDESSVPDVEAYVSIDTSYERPKYTGGRFDILDGGGAREGVAGLITPYSLLAVAYLDVKVPSQLDWS